MQPVNLRSFRTKVVHHKKRMEQFLKKLEKKQPLNLDGAVQKMAAEVWQEVDCLSCGNCCKRMTPTFTSKDITRISTHLGISRKSFTEKWLYKHEGDTDWVNKSQPCQFLEPTTNICSIYEVRPADCAEFPHFHKKKITDYLHIHSQNIEYCPATFRLVEKMMGEKANS
jgi:uncharacterized protein